MVRGLKYGAAEKRRDASSGRAADDLSVLLDDSLQLPVDDAHGREPPKTEFQNILSWRR